MGFFADKAAKHKYDISNLYVALCTVISDVRYTFGPKYYDQFFILRKDDDKFVEFFSGVPVDEVKNTDGFISHDFNVPSFDTGVIAPLTRFVKPGVTGLTMEELFYVQNSMNGIYLPNRGKLEGKDVFDVFMGDLDVEDLTDEEE